MTSTSAKKGPRSLEVVLADAKRDMRRREAMKKTAVDEAFTKINFGGINNSPFTSPLPNNTHKTSVPFDTRVLQRPRSAPPKFKRTRKSSKSQPYPNGKRSFGQLAVGTPLKVSDTSRNRDLHAPSKPTISQQTPVEPETTQAVHDLTESMHKFVESHRTTATAFEPNHSRWEAWMLRMLIKHKLEVDDSTVDLFLDFMYFECSRLKQEDDESRQQARNREVAQQLRADHATRQRYGQEYTGRNVQGGAQYRGQSITPWCTTNGVVYEPGYSTGPGMGYGPRGRRRF